MPCGPSEGEDGSGWGGGKEGKQIRAREARQALTLHSERTTASPSFLKIETKPRCSGENGVKERGGEMGKQSRMV